MDRRYSWIRMLFHWVYRCLLAQVICLIVCLMGLGIFGGLAGLQSAFSFLKETEDQDRTLRFIEFDVLKQSWDRLKQTWWLSLIFLVLLVILCLNLTYLMQAKTWLDLLLFVLNLLILLILILLVIVFAYISALYPQLSTKEAWSNTYHLVLARLLEFILCGAVIVAVMIALASFNLGLSLFLGLGIYLISYYQLIKCLLAGHSIHQLYKSYWRRDD